MAESTPTSESTQLFRQEVELEGLLVWVCWEVLELEQVKERRVSMCVLGEPMKGRGISLGLFWV